MIFIASFLTIFLLSFQQLNVVSGSYTLAIMTSFLIAIGQFTLIKKCAVSSWSSVIWMGAGGAMGCSLAMWVHP